jgi:hypothetical protein
LTHSIFKDEMISFGDVDSSKRRDSLQLIPSLHSFGCDRANPQVFPENYQ